MPLKYNYVIDSSFIPQRHHPAFLEVYSWSSVYFVTHSFESGEHSTAPEPLRWTGGRRGTLHCFLVRVHLKFDNSVTSTGGYFSILFE